MATGTISKADLGELLELLDGMSFEPATLTRQFDGITVTVTKTGAYITAVSLSKGSADKALEEFTAYMTVLAEKVQRQTTLLALVGQVKMPKQTLIAALTQSGAGTSRNHK